ncbi:hypothetical protein GCM10009119_33450 [Algoriphagus jejuensis]|uniref:DUF2188 domain-containing protein n=1 Tax=Algoriphagus jejuensis TaxID=419934 RepID=A0ABP3YG24_9BACT
MSTKDISGDLKKKFMESIEFHKDHVHVVEMSEGWVIKREGSKKTIQTASSQEAAMKAIHELKNVSKVYVHPKVGDISIEKME